uniref:Uncharacterized protein n=1 Tax=Solanum tuberosum TaxID=4113 RepID=M1DW72_SOLTU
MGEEEEYKEGSYDGPNVENVEGHLFLRLHERELPTLRPEDFAEFPWLNDAWVGETAPEDIGSDSDTSPSQGPDTKWNLLNSNLLCLYPFGRDYDVRFTSLRYQLESGDTN